ncbi:hypothetical protein TNIN_162531 [Trichonephila inaurata madagascariensis]|uniref:Uncharacterized protein n=1 Tax=Trichonephila inaurata madagascariensis TaxID=2747483 RepID=A0A8X7CD31_9ARAC|nr:hypothetical protein TNIN_162531 [Trichonephila inaurata madagascariensis]
MKATEVERDLSVSELRTMPHCTNSDCPDHSTLERKTNDNSKINANANDPPPQKREAISESAIENKEMEKNNNNPIITRSTNHDDFNTYFCLKQLSVQSSSQSSDH